MAGRAGVGKVRSRRSMSMLILWEKYGDLLKKLHLPRQNAFL